MGDGLRQQLGIGQLAALVERIGRHQVRIVGRLEPGQRLERQPEADRRVARHQEQAATAQSPQFADPAGLCLRGPALHRQHVARRLAEPALGRAHDARALLRVVDPGIARVDVGRQLAFLEQPFGRILEGRLHMLGGDAEAGGDALRESLGNVG